MSDSITTCSQPQSENTKWQNKTVVDNDATQHPKPENEVRISVQLRALTHVLKYGMQFDDVDKYGSQENTSKYARPPNKARQAESDGDEANIPRPVKGDLVTNKKRQVHREVRKSPNILITRNGAEVLGI